MAGIEAKYGGGVAIARHDYTYNDARQRESAKQSGSAFADYGDATFYRYTYNSRGELTQAVGYLGSNVTTLTAPLPGRNFEYGYDNLGNREDANTTGVPGLKADYTPNNRNQIASRENHYVPVSGTVDAAAKVVVGGALAGQQGKYWSGEVVLDNTSGPARADIPVKAAKLSPQTKQTTTVPGLIAKAVESLDYDEDGNLKEDGLWIYKWDAENRLVEMTSTLPVVGGFTQYKLEFAYDYMGRRVEKKVTNLGTSTVTTRRYLYDGWDLVADLAVVSSQWSVVRSYTWGLDVTGTLGGAGGVGGLVQLSVHDGGSVTDYYPAYDGNGNVTALVKSNGTLAAAYEYGPFGELLRAQVHDAAVADNPFRHATKFTDTETGLIYYGYRYYRPSLGRFINRDPIGEQGGINLYAFVGNDPINRADYLGLNEAGVIPSYPSGGTGYNPLYDPAADGYVFQDGILKPAALMPPTPSEGQVAEGIMAAHYDFRFNNGSTMGFQTAFDRSTHGHIIRLNGTAGGSNKGGNLRTAIAKIYQAVKRLINSKTAEVEKLPKVEVIIGNIIYDNIIYEYSIPLNIQVYRQTTKEVVGSMYYHVRKTFVDSPSVFGENSSVFDMAASENGATRFQHSVVNRLNRVQTGRNYTNYQVNIGSGTAVRDEVVSRRALHIEVPYSWVLKNEEQVMRNNYYYVNWSDSKIEANFGGMHNWNHITDYVGELKYNWGPPND